MRWRRKGWKKTNGDGHAEVRDEQRDRNVKGKTERGRRGAEGKTGEDVGQSRKDNKAETAKMRKKKWENKDQRRWIDSKEEFIKVKRMAD